MRLVHACVTHITYLRTPCVRFQMANVPRLGGIADFSYTHDRDIRPVAGNTFVCIRATLYFSFFFLYVPFQRREHRSNLHEQYR